MEKTLHMGISRVDYIDNKKNLLQMKVDLISLHEKLGKLKELRDQKAIIYRMMATAYSSFLIHFARLQRELPTVGKVPRVVEHKKSVAPVSSVSGPSSLELELRDIQDQLRELNALK